jgi:hypothetical protein
MKFTLMATMAAVLGSDAWAAARQKVVVCLGNGDQLEVANNAMPVISKIFVPAGLKLEWHGEGRSCPDHSDRIIRVSLSVQTNPDLLPGALAYALPYEGEHIVVFFDRLQRIYSGSVGILLAHVIAHEITHILQGAPRHSEEGLMKARWDREDYARMRLPPLWLTKTDLQLIRDGLAGYKDLRARRAQIAKSVHAAGLDSSRTQN